MDKRWSTVLINTLLVASGFGTMHMLEKFKNAVLTHYGITEAMMGYQQTAYVVGLFVAFLLGGTSLFKGSFKRSVALIVSFAAIPQFLIPFMPSWWGVVALRFFQGFIVALIAVFSNQIGRLFVAERPFAKGVILSGIFWGGIYGINLAKWAGGSDASWSSVREAFLISAVLMYVMLAIWWLFVEDFEIPKEKHSSGVNVWKMPFTWVFGFTFFPALWIIFTLGSFTLHNVEFSDSQVANLVMTLEVSMGLWSIIMGYLGYRLSVKNTSNRGLFKAIVSVMTLSYAVTFLGIFIVWKAISANDYTLALLGIAITGIVQGTGPAFWTTAPAAYPKEIYPEASFALGLISNSANAVAPNVMFVLVHSVTTGMIIYLGMALLGILLLLASSRMRLPVEELS
ncbi:Permeases of the major facilitator superfamily [Thermococcus nautili]|uniref:MFS transporter n=1 Tax=Thermococcus nautili TaxID=195522 RepID=UPI00255738DF|nr:MFS transporter [Thermococcus nautili]CAI1493144.1 Permeases of the major facilitator superfamily [Thermococcus nautili]